ncbi:Fur-regulated basic protein A [Halobacillus alkaliphilus]|uniref:Fur-regulated basic protein A n=1 Tax=Halobacillus alkaliphilus TaxID=396056 RepID=A0A1I2M7U2_9BACI|nr:Fur-regulated basic protein FbpA [Halobacillus alkaliphilus]SFF86908.1 Fur-regulated basic protein A [Halobacillus alkaliphilus]
MKNHLRDAVEAMKEHYIKRLIHSGVVQSTDEALQTLTLTQLEALVKRLDKTGP